MRLLAQPQTRSSLALPPIQVVPRTISKPLHHKRGTIAKRLAKTWLPTLTHDPLPESKISTQGMCLDLPQPLLMDLSFACAFDFTGCTPTLRRVNGTVSGHNFNPDGGAAAAAGDPASDRSGLAFCRAPTAALPVTAAAIPARVLSPDSFHPPIAGEKPSFCPKKSQVTTAPVSSLSTLGSQALRLALDVFRAALERAWTQQFMIVDSSLPLSLLTEILLFLPRSRR